MDLYNINRYNWLAEKLTSCYEYDEVYGLQNILQKSSFGTQLISSHLHYLIGKISLTGDTFNVDEPYCYDQFKTSLHYLINDTNLYYVDMQCLVFICQGLAYLGRHRDLIHLVVRVARVTHSLGHITDQSIETGSEDMYKNIERVIQYLDNNDYIMNNETGEKNVPFLSQEPKLWFVISSALYYKQQFELSKKASSLALKLTSSVESKFKVYGKTHNTTSSIEESIETSDPFKIMSTSSLDIMHHNQICDPYIPQTKLIELISIFKNSGYQQEVLHLLYQLNKYSTLSFALHQLMALLIATQKSLSSKHMAKSIEILDFLNVLSVTTHNPCSRYNSLANKFCYEASVGPNKTPIAPQNFWLSIHDQILKLRSGDKTQNLNLLLTTSFVYLTYDSTKENTYTDMIIDTLKKSDVLCQSSSSFWNNLGLANMLKKKQLGTITSLMKAEQLNPLDWRICINLGIICMNLGMLVKSLCYFSRAAALLSNYASNNGKTIINSYLGVILDSLGNDIDEANRFHAVASESQVPFAIINHLIHLYNNNLERKPMNDLLKNLEIRWMSRRKSCSEFSCPDIIPVASQIVNYIKDEDGDHHKDFAWMIDETLPNNA